MAGDVGQQDHRSPSALTHCIKFYYNVMHRKFAMSTDLPITKSAYFEMYDGVNFSRGISLTETPFCFLVPGLYIYIFLLFMSQK